MATLELGHSDRTFRISTNYPLSPPTWVRGPTNRLRTTIQVRGAGNYQLHMLGSAIRMLRRDMPGCVITVF